jgi:superfamily II DNA or RNA helicase
MKKLREYQNKAINEIAYKSSLGKKRICLQLATGGGKCLGKDTPILMFNGAIKKVQDIISGDLIMGPDSKLRNVLSTCTGKEMLYKVTPTKGDPYIINESHILSLKVTNISHKRVTAPDGKKYSAGEIVNISVKDYLSSSLTFKHVAKGYRVGLNFSNKDTLPIPPYILGLWLGDGNSNRMGFATKDIEIVNSINEYAINSGCYVRSEIIEGKCPMYYISGLKSRGVKGGSNLPLTALQKEGLINNKHIPHKYLTASYDDRLNLLAGLVDSDGYSHHSGYDFIFKNEKIADGLCFIARSVGLSAYKMPCKKTCYNNGVVGNYFRVSISGNCSIIPAKLKRRISPIRKQIKSTLLTGIKVDAIGIGDYYGFDIDGDRLFVLGDFTVTHNTVCFAGLIHRFLNKKSTNVLILVHREELLRQARKTLYEWYGLIAEPITAGTRNLPNGNIFVAMAETANNRLKKNPNYFPNIGLVIVDEAHLGSFRKLLLHFPDCLTIGFTATPISAKKKEPLNGIYEDIVTCIDIPDLIAEGSLCPNITYHVKNINRKELSISKGEFDDKVMGAAYSKPKQVHNTVEAYKNNCLGKKTLIFNCNVEHSKLVCAAFLQAGLPARHLDGNSTDRKEAIEWFKNTEDAILCNVGILTTGFDEPSVCAIIMNKATLSLPLWLQCTGRGSRPYPGKDHFIILDLGGNALSHGDWSSTRDWKDIFENPDKPSDGGGVAAVRECGQCNAIIPASSKVCRFCGFERIIEVAYDGDPIVLELFKNSTVDVKKVIEENEGKKDYAALHRMKTLIVYEAKRNGVRSLTDNSAATLSELYQNKVKQWCKEKSKRYNSWHKETTAEWFNAELKRVYNYQATT